MAFDKKAYQKKYHKEYYPKNREKLLEGMRKRLSELSPVEKEKDLIRRRERNKKHHTNRKNSLFDLMDNKCKCCGEDDPIYLQIDHVNNDGHLERKNRSRRGPKLTLKKYLEAPEKFQLLCANCNWAKQQNGGKLYKPKKKRKR